MNPDLEMIGRLALAMFLGGCIGLERETHAQSAGLRTHMVVAIGAALIMLVSIRITDGGHGDPGRIAAQVVSGIGFLGAGAILRYGMSIKGLTTAACLWTAAGIGMACGMGYWKGALAATGLTLVATFIFDKIERKFLVERKYKRFVITAKDSPGVIGHIETIFERHGMALQNVGLQKDFVQKKVELSVSAAWPETADLDELTRELNALNEIEKVDIDG